MLVQKKSAQAVIARCKKLGVRTVAGGPLFTAESENFEGVDHLVLNEAEITFSMFLADFKEGKAKHLYSSRKFADIESTPVPQWNLVKMKKYVSMTIQYSRGCPYNCDFCDITNLYGHIRNHFGYGGAVIKSMWNLGVIDKERFYFWELFFWSLFKRPQLLPMAISYTIYGYHFRKVLSNYVTI